MLLPPAENPTNSSLWIVQILSPLYDIGEVDGRHFLSMEFIDGEDLSSLLRRIGRLPGDKAIVCIERLKRLLRARRFFFRYFMNRRIDLRGLRLKGSRFRCGSRASITRISALLNDFGALR